MMLATRKTCAAALAVVATLLPHAAGAEDCFAIGDNRQLTYDVFQIGTPPRARAGGRDYVERSPGYPASDYATTSIRALQDKPATSGEPAFRKHYLLWANRCIYLKDITPSPEACRNTARTKGNGYPAMALGALDTQLRAAYSTYERANACTVASAMVLLGESSEAVAAKARSAGIDIVTTTADRATLASLARTVVAGTGRNAMSTKFLVDVCVVESAPMGQNTAGIVLDYEVFDNRTPAEALAFMREMTALLKGHGKTLIVNTNPIPREPNGINASNVRNIIDVVDGFAPTLSSGASLGNPDTYLARQERKHSPIDSYKTQLAALTGNGTVSLSPAIRGKVIWNISLHDTSLSEARQLRDEILRQGYRGIMLFRNYVKQGGTCDRPSNQLTACLAFGTCDGTFGHGR